MDAIFLAALAVWFSGRALYMAYQLRKLQKAFILDKFTIVALRETLDYAHETLSRIDKLEGECLKAFYEKAYKHHTDEFIETGQNQLDEKGQR